MEVPVIHFLLLFGFITFRIITFRIITFRIITFRIITESITFRITLDFKNVVNIHMIFEGRIQVTLYVLQLKDYIANVATN